MSTKGDAKNRQTQPDQQNTGDPNNKSLEKKMNKPNEKVDISSNPPKKKTDSSTNQTATTTTLSVNSSKLQSLKPKSNENPGLTGQQTAPNQKQPKSKNDTTNEKSDKKPLPKKNCNH